MNLPAILRNPSLLLRLAIDLLLLHISMFFAITCASIFYTMSAGATSQSLLNAELLQSYEILALGIAPLFLVVLYFGGVYDRRWSSESSESACSV